MNLLPLLSPIWNQQCTLMPRHMEQSTLFEPSEQQYRSAQSIKAAFGKDQQCEKWDMPLNSGQEFYIIRYPSHKTSLHSRGPHKIRSYLSHVCRLSTHVRASDDLKTFLVSQQRHIICNEGHIILHFQTRMPTTLEHNISLSYRCK